MKDDKWQICYIFQGQAITWSMTTDAHKKIYFIS